MDKISILMTVYNGENVLNETIIPLINQTYQNIEIVIVNDGSSDASASIIETFANSDSRILFINRKENKGRVFSLNEGLAYCTGRYVAINDADDISSIDRIEKMVNFINQKGINGKFGVVGSSHITEDRINNTKENYKVKTGSFGSRVTKTRLFFGMPFIHSSFIYNKDALLNVGGFASEVTAFIDYFTLLKISNNYPIYAYTGITVTRIKDGNNFFLKPHIIAQKNKNREIIREWQKNNYTCYESLNVVRTIRDKIQRNS